MPFKIIREDITKVKCDAIVNPTNEDLIPGGGVDATIHEVAGKELFEMCQAIGGLDVGKAKVTPAYNLPYWRSGPTACSAGGVHSIQNNGRLQCCHHRPYPGCPGGRL